MCGSFDKTPECGFTLLETLVMLVITALVASIVIPLSGEGVRDNFRLADRVLLAGERGASEGEYRALLRRAVPPLVHPDGSVEDTGFVGIPTALRFPAEGEPALTCPGITGYWVVRLRLERKASGGRLLCDGAAGTRQLMEWDRGEASFSYSWDGSSWYDSWPIGRVEGVPRKDAPPLVRLSLREGRNTRLLWIERAGDMSLSDPTDVERPYFGGSRLNGVRGRRR